MTEKGESFVPVFYQVLDNVEQLMTDGFSQEEKEDADDAASAGS